MQGSQPGHPLGYNCYRTYTCSHPFSFFLDSGDDFEVIFTRIGRMINHILAVCFKVVFLSKWKFNEIESDLLRTVMQTMVRRWSDLSKKWRRPLLKKAPVYYNPLLGRRLGNGRRLLAKKLKNY